MCFQIRQHLALVVHATRGNKVDSFTMTFTVRSSSTRHSCWPRNLAASFSGGMGMSISILYLWYSLCSKYRNIFPCTVYGSSNVKQDSMRGFVGTSWAREAPPGASTWTVCRKGQLGCQPSCHFCQPPISKDKGLDSKGRGWQGKRPVAVLNLWKFSSEGYHYPDHYTIWLHLEYYQSDLSMELAHGLCPV